MASRRVDPFWCARVSVAMCSLTAGALRVGAMSSADIGSDPMGRTTNRIGWDTPADVTLDVTGDDDDITPSPCNAGNR